MKEEIIKIAQLHIKRIEMALKRLEPIIPFTAKTVELFTDDDILLTDLLVNRFGKLQDLLGAKIIPQFLIYTGEDVDRLTMIDKINLLERLEVIENAELWVEMRKARNKAAHEYPDDFYLTADYLNHIVVLYPKLFEIFINIKNKYEKIR